MELREAIYTRRSVREFTVEPVDDKIIRELIDAAVQAPSAVNQQPCSFCVVRDKKVLARISREAKTYMLKNTPVGLMSHHFSEILNDANFDIFYHAPVLGVISTVADMPWATEDAALAAENLMLAARAAGLTLRNYTIKNIWCRDPRSIRYRFDRNLRPTTGQPARAPYYEDAAENPNRRSVCLTTKRL